MIILVHITLYVKRQALYNHLYTIADLRTPPANRLEKLSGTRTGQYSIRINDQWRVCFEWRSNAAYNVEISDYH
jgi:toxin HigB-1